jgi:uncharacterized membrane protein HdeD (DUF308 family)
MNDTVPNDEALDEERGYGWLMFASIVLIVAGIMRILDAIWAWRYNGVLPDEFQEAILGNDLDTYGWLWAIVGVVLILAGVAVNQRSQWARWIGILAGAILAITAVGWMPVYPVWSLVYILIGLFVIYGLAAHGGRLRMPV